MSSNYKFAFRCVDNGGKHQAFTVSAPNQAAAIEKALKKAEKTPQATFAAVGRSSYSRVSEGTAPAPDTLAEPHRAPKRTRPIK